MISFLCIVNILVFFLYGYDKRQAKQHGTRISERTLLICTGCFGGLGALLGMHFFHHKTKKMKFNIIVPCLFVLQIVLLVWLYMR